MMDSSEEDYIPPSPPPVIPVPVPVASYSPSVSPAVSATPTPDGYVASPLPPPAPPVPPVSPTHLEDGTTVVTPDGTPAKVKTYNPPQWAEYKERGGWKYFLALNSYHFRNLFHFNLAAVISWLYVALLMLIVVLVSWVFAAISSVACIIIIGCPFLLFFGVVSFVAGIGLIVALIGALITFIGAAAKKKLH